LLKNCVNEFGSWEADVEFGSGHFTSIQGAAAPLPFDANKFLKGLEWGKDDYKKYQTCRDREEFRLHAKPPYNDIPAPLPPKVETDPNKIPVMTTISREQLIHVTLLEPVVAPNRPSGVAMA